LGGSRRKKRGDGDTIVGGILQFPLITHALFLPPGIAGTTFWTGWGPAQEKLGVVSEDGQVGNRAGPINIMGCTFFGAKGTEF